MARLARLAADQPRSNSVLSRAMASSATARTPSVCQVRPRVSVLCQLIGPPVAEVAAGGHDHPAVAAHRDEPLHGDGGGDALPEQLRQPARLAPARPSRVRRPAAQLSLAVSAFQPPRSISCQPSVRPACPVATRTARPGCRRSSRRGPRPRPGSAPAGRARRGGHPVHAAYAGRGRPRVRDHQAEPREPAHPAIVPPPRQALRYAARLLRADAAQRLQGPRLGPADPVDRDPERPRRVRRSCAARRRRNPSAARAPGGRGRPAARASPASPLARSPAPYAPRRPGQPVPVGRSTSSSDAGACGPAGRPSRSRLAAERVGHLGHGGRPAAAAGPAPPPPPGPPAAAPPGWSAGSSPRAGGRPRRRRTRGSRTGRRSRSGSRGVWSKRATAVIRPRQPSWNRSASDRSLRTATCRATIRTSRRLAG